MSIKAKAEIEIAEKAMQTKYEPKRGEKWRLRSDHNKVLTVDWTNPYGYVSFKAPWMKKQSGCSLDTFHKRYERA